LFVSSAGYEKSEMKSAVCENPAFIIASQRTKRVLSGGSESRVPCYEHELQILATPEAPVGTTSGNVLITLETEGGPIEVRAFLEADITGSVKCVPPRLVWVNGTGGASLSGEVSIRAGKSEFLDVSQIEVTSPSSDVECQLQNLGDGKAIIRVQMTLPTTGLQKVMKSCVTGTVEGREVLKIPLLAFVKSAAQE
jgi:hypothetical protein